MLQILFNYLFCRADNTRYIHILFLELSETLKFRFKKIKKGTTWWPGSKTDFLFGTRVVSSDRLIAIGWPTKAPMRYHNDTTGGASVFLPAGTTTLGFFLRHR
jgi:hypothetical protein